MGKMNLEKLNSIAHRASGDPNQTKLHPSQPLNVIAGDGLDDTSPDDSMVAGEDNEKVEHSLDDTKSEDNEKWGDVKEICKICQIEPIVGTCLHCGIYLYGSEIYPNFPVQFDMKVRRRQ